MNLAVPLPRVLIVDDDPDVRRVFSLALSRSCETIEAPGGRQAITMLEELEFELLLLDLHMPGVDGFAVLEHLAKLGGQKAEMPVIVITADSTVEARARALRARSVYFLSKPVPIRVLSDLVDATVKRSSLRPSKPAREP